MGSRTVYAMGRSPTAWTILSGTNVNHFEVPYKAPTWLDGAGKGMPMAPPQKEGAIACPPRGPGVPFPTWQSDFHGVNGEGLTVHGAVHLGRKGHRLCLACFQVGHRLRSRPAVKHLGPHVYFGLCGASHPHWDECNTA